MSHLNFYGHSGWCKLTRGVDIIGLACLLDIGEKRVIDIFIKKIDMEKEVEVFGKKPV